jgi:hypothetical protein
MTERRGKAHRRLQLDLREPVRVRRRGYGDDVPSRMTRPKVVAALQTLLTKVSATWRAVAAERMAVSRTSLLESLRFRGVSRVGGAVGDWGSDVTARPPAVGAGGAGRSPMGSRRAGRRGRLGAPAATGPARPHGQRPRPPDTTRPALQRDGAVAVERGGTSCIRAGQRISTTDRVRRPPAAPLARRATAGAGPCLCLRAAGGGRRLPVPVRQRPPALQPAVARRADGPRGRARGGR